MGGVQASTILNGVTLPPNFSWIDEGKLAGCGLPQTKEELLGLQKVGIGIVINLTEVPTEGGLINTGYIYPPNIKEGAKGLNMVHISVPDGAPPTNEQMDLIACKMGETINTGKGAVVHCYKGEGRTGTMIAAFFVKNGATAEEAISFVRSKRAKSIHTKVQEDAVRNYESFVKLHQPDNDKIVKDQNLMIQLDGKYILVKVVDPEPTVDLIEMMTGMSKEDILKNQSQSNGSGGGSGSSGGQTNNSSGNPGSNGNPNTQSKPQGQPTSTTTTTTTNGNGNGTNSTGSTPAPSNAKEQQKGPTPSANPSGEKSSAFSLFGGRPPVKGVESGSGSSSLPQPPKVEDPTTSVTQPQKGAGVDVAPSIPQPVQSPPAQLSQRTQLQPDNGADESKSFISDIRPTSPSRRLQMEEIISPETSFNYQGPVNIYAMNDMLNSMNSAMDNMMSNIQRRSKLGSGGMKPYPGHFRGTTTLGFGNYRSWDSSLYNTTG